MGKAANGIADNLLLTTYLSAKCPVFWAPAMDLDMFKHTAVQANINKLITYGNHIIDAETGELASGLDGKGRMAEPEKIVENIESYFNSKKKLNNFKVLITAGPTHEKIDPVRYIGNRSSGKMGFALAETLAEKGAEVTLITGPVSIKPVHSKINLISVESADEMYHQSKKKFSKNDIIIFAAAVADYTPAKPVDSKIKKKTSSINIELKATKDIAAELSKIKNKKQITVGFALETDNELKNAQKKILKKNFDFIVLNSLKDKGAGFAYDTNKISIIDKDNNIERFELKSKKEVAKDIIKKIIDLIPLKT